MNLGVRRLAHLAGALAVLACSNSHGSAPEAREPPLAERDRAARVRDSPDPASGTFQDYLDAGEEAYFRGEHDSARGIWEGVLRDARVARDSVAQCRALTWLGLVAWREGDYDAARDLGENGLACKIAQGLEADFFRSYNALGLLAWNEGRLADAVGLFENASEAASKAGDAKGVASAAGNLALVHAELGEFAKARRGFLAAREVGGELGDRRIEGNALTNLGMLEVKVGDPVAALGWLGEARRLYRAEGYPTGEQNALGQVGTAYAALGEPRRALAALDSALALSRAQGLRQEEAGNLEALADLHREAGDFQRALALFRQAQRITAELGLDLEAAADLRSEAQILAHLGDLPQASRKAEDALRIHRSAGARHEELADLLLLAELSAEGAPTRAHRWLADARRLAADLGTPLSRLETAVTEARVALVGGDAGVALAALAPVTRDLSLGAYGLEWQVHALRARSHARRGDLDSAAVAARLAVDAVERVRGKFASGVLWTSYGADKASAYADLVDILLRLGRVDEAFEYADAARGGVLREQLLATTAGSQTGAARALRQGEGLLREIEELTRTLASLEQAASESEDSPPAASTALVRGRLREARQEYEALLVRTSELDREDAALIGGRRIRAARVRDALSEHEAMLEYLALPDRIVLFVVRRDGIRPYETALTEENLASRIRLARGILESPGRGDLTGSDVLESLYDALIGPAVRAGALAGARRLVVVPHGTLTYLPFAALRDGITGRWLVEDFSVLTLPSAAVLPALRVARRGSSIATLAEGLDVLAPFPDRLPGTWREARALEEARSSVTIWSGEEATEGALREALSRGTIVHVASHGVLNARSPMFSRIELAPGRSGDTADDGRLEVHEILGLSVAAPLVFLSGCETGLGKAWSTQFARGEEYATLAQAFLHAGAANVVATLWRVEDEGAAYVAERFHHHLRTSAPVDALALAQREALRRGRLASPYQWAAYVVSGAGDIRRAGGSAPR